MIAGRRPNLALMTPPQHGKFRAVSDFIAWLAGVNPDIKMFASYSDELGAHANTELQRAIKSDAFKSMFGRIVVGIDNWVKYVDQVDAVAPEYKQRFSIGRRYFTA